MCLKRVWESIPMRRMGCTGNRGLAHEMPGGQPPPPWQATKLQIFILLMPPPLRSVLSRTLVENPSEESHQNKTNAKNKS